MGDSSVSSKSSGLAIQTSVTSSISKSSIRESCVVEGSVVGSSNNSSSIGGSKGSISTSIQKTSISISFRLSISITLANQVSTIGGNSGISNISSKISIGAGNRLVSSIHAGSRLAEIPICKAAIAKSSIEAGISISISIGSSRKGRYKD